MGVECEQQGKKKKEKGNWQFGTVRDLLVSGCNFTGPVDGVLRTRRTLSIAKRGFEKGG